MAEVRKYPIGSLPGLYTHSVYRRFENTADDLNLLKSVIATQKSQATEGIGEKNENIMFLRQQIVDQKIVEFQVVNALGFKNVDDFIKFVINMKMQNNKTFGQFIEDALKESSNMFRTLGHKDATQQEIDGNKYVRPQVLEKIFLDLVDTYSDIIDYHTDLISGQVNTDTAGNLKAARTSLRKIYQSIQSNSQNITDPVISAALSKIETYLFTDPTEPLNMAGEGELGLKPLVVGSVLGYLFNVRSALQTYAVQTGIEEFPMLFGSQVPGLVMETRVPTKGARSVVDIPITFERVGKNGTKITGNLNMSLKTADLYKMPENKKQINITARIATPSATQFFSFLEEQSGLSQQDLEELRYLILNINRFNSSGAAAQSWNTKGLEGKTVINKGKIKHYENEIFYLIQHLVGLFLGQSTQEIQWREGEDIHFIWFGSSFVPKSKVMEEVLNTMLMPYRKNLASYNMLQNEDTRDEYLKYSKMAKVKFSVMMDEMSKQVQKDLKKAGEMNPIQEYDQAKKRILKSHKGMSKKPNIEYYGILQSGLHSMNQELWKKISVSISLHRKEMSLT